MVSFLGVVFDHCACLLFRLAIDPGFFEAQAVVLSNMQQHKQALEIYVFRMNDYAKAEE